MIDLSKTQLPYVGMKISSLVNEGTFIGDYVFIGCWRKEGKDYVCEVVQWHNPKTGKTISNEQFKNELLQF